MAFLVFEGLDGAGKSTLMNELVGHLKARSIEVVLTREPGGTSLGEEIRGLLLRRDGEAPTPKAELLLYEAGRAQHVELVIRPALKRKAWVICDRFTASSVAFQSGGRGISSELINELNKIATDDLQPDLWVLLDLSVQEAERRMQGRELDRFEVEAKDFHERVRQSYLQQAKQSPPNWLVLDASLPVGDLKTKLLNALEARKFL